MTNMNAVTIRNPGAITPRQPADGLAGQMALAQSISQAPTSMLPKGYQNNAGACLLAIDYAARMDIALFDVFAEVSFNRGRPTVGARLQTKLADREGYTTKQIEGDAESCTVAVIGPDGVEVGRETYTMQIAEDLGICYMKDDLGNRVLKPTWKGDRAQMLWHRATTRALDRHAPKKLAGIFADPLQDEPDVFDELAPEAIETVVTPPDATEEVAAGTPSGPPSGAQGPAPENITDGPGAGSAITAETIQAAHEAKGLSKASVIAIAKEMHGPTMKTFGIIAAHSSAGGDVMDWIDQQ